MFEKLPYTNFHDLNLDWVISVVKDFQNKYDHIQELIDSGIVALNEKTQQSLSELNTLSENLLTQLNEWYSQHHNYLDATLAANIATFNTQANTKIQEALESIPEDYTELSTSVTQLRNLFDYLVNNHITPYAVVTDMYIDPTTYMLRVGAGSDRTIRIDAEANTLYTFKKTAPTVVRVGISDTANPVNNATYMWDYQTNGTASEVEFKIQTTDTKTHIYIQMFIDSDNPTYKTIPANVESSVLVGEDPAKTILREDLGILGVIMPELITGKFVNATNGQIADSSNFSMTAPIPIKRGQTINLTGAGYLTNVAMICTCNADNTERQVKVASLDGSLRTYSYQASEDGYVCCSFNSYHLGHTISMDVDYFSMYQSIAEILREDLGILGVIMPELITGKFVNATNGQIADSSNFSMTAPIPIKRGQTINLTGAGYLTNVAMICTCNADNTERQVKVASLDGSLRTYSYQASEDGYVCCSFNSYHLGHTISMDVDYFSMYQSIADIVPDIHYEQYFNNIICLGDSLTNGATGSSSPVNLRENYPFYLKKRTDADYTIQAEGGYSPTQFWSNIAYSYDYSGFDAAIIYLGTNGGLTDTVSQDCKADYHQNANTNTGNYGKIIGRIKETAPHCKIFLIAGPNEYINRANTMNPAVRALASFYNVNLIDLESCVLSDNGNPGSPERYLYRPVDGIHYNQLGYFTFGNLVGIEMNHLVRANLSMLNN